MYLLPDQPATNDAALRLACQLVGKAWPQHRRISICCPPPQQAQLDELLWQLPAGRFIAHGISGSDSAEQAPVQISTEPSTASMLIQLHAEVPAAARLEQYQRILDVIGPGEPLRQQGRRRYRHYQQYTSDLHIHKL